MSGVPQAKEDMFKEYLIPANAASRVLNVSTCRLFLDSMWSNLTESGVTFGAIELCFGKKGYKLDQVTYMLSEEYAPPWCKGWGYPEPVDGDEYWLSHKPGIFSKYFKRFSLDKSTKGYTKEDVKDFVDLSNVTQKVKTQVTTFCSDVIDTGGHILAITTPLNIPFANKVKVFCIPARPKSQNSASPDDVIKFATSLGFSHDFSMLEAVELTSKSKQGFAIALDYLKSIGLANESHVPKQLNGFHHIKLTFENKKVTPKLYTWIGYSKYNDPKPQRKPSSRNS